MSSTNNNKKLLLPTVKITREIWKCNECPQFRNNIDREDGWGPDLGWCEMQARENREKGFPEDMQDAYLNNEIGNHPPPRWCPLERLPDKSYAKIYTLKRMGPGHGGS